MSRLAIIPRLASGIRGSDAMMIGVIALVIMLIILPLPALMIDVLVALNLTIGVLLVLSVLYVKKPLDFSTFPSVLLVTTLLRVGISVATTRLILSTATGGHIIEQFGQMAAGGNIVIGLVVFLIITIVQFLVIAKGGERVAEVAARFSLDAMPGKQLSIDSDLRSGLLTKEDAREKRRLVEQESRLYGSLDGAMKFVKGDSIVTIVIVLINLLGGLAVGVFQHGMSTSEAVGTFSLLSIGDGLVAQIPAFFSALAAGLLVTRATDEETESDLGPMVASQIFGKPHVLAIAAGMAVLLGLIPGFPKLVFLALAIALGVGAAWKYPASHTWMRSKLGLKDVAASTAGDPMKITTTALETVDAAQLRIMGQPLGAAELSTLSQRIQARLQAVQDQSGIRLPTVRVVHQPEATADGPRWALFGFDAPLGAGPIETGLLDERLADYVGELMRRNLSMFMGLQEVTDLLNWLGDEYPEVVKEAVRTVPTSTIAEVLRLLAEEQVPLRNLRDALEAIAEAGQMERDPRIIAERVRVAMRRNIVAPLCIDGRLRVLMIGAAVEDNIRGLLTDIDGQMRIAIDPLQMRAMVALLRQETAASGARAILTSQDLRRPLRLITAADLYEIPVLAFNELNPAVPLDVVGELNHSPDTLGYAQPEAAE